MTEDQGFSLLEVMVTMVLASILGGLGLMSLQAYGRAQDFQGSADSLVSTLRTTAERSLSEGRTYCIHVDAAGGEWTTYERSCQMTSTTVGTTAARGGTDLQAGNFATPAAGRPCPAAGECVYFYPRGTATPGTVELRRGSSTPITVTVEGLSSRVSRS